MSKKSVPNAKVSVTTSTYPHNTISTRIMTNVNTRKGKRSNTSFTCMQPIVPEAVLNKFDKTKKEKNDGLADTSRANYSKITKTENIEYITNISNIPYIDNATNVSNTINSHSSANAANNSHLLETYVEPHPNDVLLGRGHGVTTWQGNIKFREIILSYRDEYMNSVRYQKHTIATKIVKEIADLNPPGRFVEIVGDDLFQIIDYGRVIEKVCRALRQKRAFKSRRLPTAWKNQPVMQER